MSLTKEIRLRALPPRSPLSGTGVSGLTHFCSSWLAFTHCKGRAGGSKGDRKARQPSFWKAAGESTCTETTDPSQPQTQKALFACTQEQSLFWVIFWVDTFRSWCALLSYGEFSCQGFHLSGKHRAWARSSYSLVFCPSYSKTQV